MKYRFNPKEWAGAALMLVEDPDSTLLADLTLLCTVAMSPGIDVRKLSFEATNDEITGEVDHLNNTDVVLHFGFLCLRLAEEFYAEGRVRDIPGRSDVFNIYSHEIKKRLREARLCES